MTINKTVKIKEIFTSIQGEGPYVGVRQTFVRFCECNLKCAYCDTDITTQNAKEYGALELAQIINEDKKIHSVAITGGEPLLYADFLEELFEQLKLPIYLETNATLVSELKKVIAYVNFVSADIKLPSAAGSDTFEKHEEFLKVCIDNGKKVFAKVVYDNKITDSEIIRTANIAKKFNILLILQPMMKGDKPVTDAEFNEQIFNKFIKIHSKVRLIPQMHKFMGLK